MTTMTSQTGYTASQPTQASSAPWACAERILSVPVAEARKAVLAALRTAGYQIDAQQLFVITASRGSRLGSLTQNPDKLPIAATARFAATEQGSGVWIGLGDRGAAGLGQLTGSAGAYRVAFEKVLTSLDAALGRLDPAASFVEPQFSMPAHAWRPPSSVARGTAGFTSWVKDSLEGPVSGPADRGWRDAGGASIVSPEGVAMLGVSALQLMATVGTQIIDNPGPVPHEKVARLAELVNLLDSRLSAPNASVALVQIEVRADQVKVVEFLRDQARIRQSVPLRTRERCVTCDYEKIVNPDYQALTKRIKTIRTLSGSFGAIIGRGGLASISPVVLVGKLLQLKQLDPNFVCPRCQGMDSDCGIVTFCPSCHARRDDTVLRECSNCHYDFRNGLPQETLWQEAAPAEITGTMESAAPAAQAAWCPDPYGAPQLRWWDGYTWTEHVHQITQS